MSVSHVSTSITNADGSALSKSVVATEGYGILLCIEWSPDVDNRTIGVPTWNGQTLDQLGSTINTAGGKLAVFFIVAAASATANLSSTYSDFVVANTQITIVDAGSDEIVVSALSQQVFSSGTYSSPSLLLTNVPTGALVISMLQANSFDQDFTDVSATTWSPDSPAISRGSYQNTGTWRVNILAGSTDVGSGSDLTISWAASAGQPMYTHVAFYFSSAALVADLVTLSASTVVAGTGYNGTTANMAAITSLTNATITGTSTNAFTYSMNPWVHGGVYLRPTGSPIFTASDGTLSDTLASPLAPMAGYTAVTMASIDRGEWSVGKDAAILNTDVICLPTIGGVLNPNGTLGDGAGGDYIFGTYTMWRWEAATSIMWTSQLTVSQSGLSIDNEILYPGVKNQIIYNPIHGVLYS